MKIFLKNTMAAAFILMPLATLNASSISPTQLGANAKELMSQGKEAEAKKLITSSLVCAPGSLDSYKNELKNIFNEPTLNEMFTQIKIMKSRVRCSNPANMNNIAATNNPSLNNVVDPSIMDKEVLDPRALANKAKMHMNNQEEAKAKELVQATIRINKYTLRDYIFELKKLLPSDKVDEWTTLPAPITAAQ